MDATQKANDFKSYVVLDRRGKLKFPESIAKPRSEMPKRIWISLFLFCFSIMIYENEDILLCLETLSHVILSYYAVEMITRFIYTCEEFFNHFKSRYESNIAELLMFTFSFPYGSVALIVLSAMVALHFFMVHGWVDRKLNTSSFLNVLVFVFMLTKYLKDESAPIYNSMRFEENNGLNYSSAMAHSFYHGYLRLILPKTGGEDKNLIEIIGCYSDRNKVNVYPKLFILFPKSAICPVSLEGPNIVESSSLEEKELTIAGVQKRVYKNSVYKIKDPEDEKKYHYVCAEYATPLRTFWKALEASGPYNENFKKHKNDIILHFYLIMRDLVRNDPDICNLCEMIYFDDQNSSRDVSQILLKKGKIPQSR